MGRVSTVADLLPTVLPHLSTRVHEVLAVVATKAGRVGGADGLARQLGLQNRYCLARMLEREGLPPFEELCGWMCVLDLLSHYEETHASLYQLALRSTRDPPTCYRTIKRIIGKTWVQARSEGFHFALMSFLQRCGGLRAVRNVVLAKGS